MSPSNALFCSAFPCNPRPFARALDEGCIGNSGWIRTDEAKRILWVLICQAYGQLAVVDTCKEWDRLYDAAGRPSEDSLE